MLKDLTIMYVEDDKFTRNLIKKALEKLVKKVYLAEDGLEGLNLYKKFLPNIVLTDMNMPNMDGLLMSKRIRDISPTQIIGMFTADLQEETTNEAKLLPIDTYLLKPLNRKNFLNSLEHLGKLALTR